MILFQRISFWLALCGVGAVLLLLKGQGKPRPNPGPVSAPPRSPYARTVASTGLIEASRENVKVAAPREGPVTRVFVKVGDAVKASDPLFQIDDREVRARIRLLEAQVASLRAQAGVDASLIADLDDQVTRFVRLGRDRVATEDEVKRREFSLATAKAKAAATAAAIAAAEEAVRQAGTDLEILTVRAPRDGRLLQVNLREGEFASVKSAEPLMLLGDVDRFQVRAEVDEQDAVLIRSQQPAVASLKGHSDLRMTLKFVRIEPYVVPKRSLTGDSLERVDTRVLQVVYAFERPAFPVYVGQQVDVFIQRPESAPAASR
ncbi:MAG: efflux RND transporter periplasmic adaptor subunit [Verrucomicrobiota bacterium]